MVDLRNLGGDPAGSSGGGGGGGGDADIDVDFRNIGGDPAGDADRDTDTQDDTETDLRNIGGDPAEGGTTEQEGEDTQDDPQDVEVESDEGTPGDVDTDRITDDARTEQEQGLETSDAAASPRARAIEDAIIEQNPRLRREHIDVTSAARGEDPTIELTQEGQEVLGASRRGGIGGLVGDPAGLTPEQVERRIAGQRGAISGTVGDPVGLNEQQAAEERARLGGIIEELVSDPSGRSTTAEAEEEARLNIESQLEERLDTDLDQEDIEFEREGGQITGRLTPAAQEELQVQQDPLVQLAEDTPLERVFEVGATFGVRQAAERRRRRTELFDTIGQREEADALIEDIGLSEEREQFESLQRESNARLDQVRDSIADAARRAEAMAAAPVAIPIGAALEETDTSTEVIENIPSPRENPEAFAAAAAPIAVAEPTPVGELAVGGALIAGGALAASEARGGLSEEQRVEQIMQAEATAEVPGLFPPEQTVPEDDGLFVPEEEVEPPLFDRPEFLPPTDPASNIQTGRLTRPELEQPQEAIGRGFFEPEFEQPEEPIGRGFFPAEQDVPTAEAASALQQIRETRESVDRERRRQRQEQTIPDEFIPDEPTTIGGGTGAGIGEAGEGATGEGAGVRVVFRPSPRSMELRRIETDEGGFRIGPEFTRFLGAQTLDAETGPELGEVEQFEEVPPSEIADGELAAAQRIREAQRTTPLSESVIDEGQATGVDVTPTTAQIPLTDVELDEQQTQGQRTVTVEATETTTPGLGEGFPTETVEVPEEPVNVPTETVTQTRPAETERRPPIPDFDQFEEVVVDDEVFDDELFESGIADIDAAEQIEDRILGGEGGSSGDERSLDDIESEILDGV